MKRSLNFTGRQKLKRQHVQITAGVGGNQLVSIAVAFDLDEYKLPPDGRIFVEAHRHTSWHRADFGEICHIRTSPTQLPPEFGTGEGVHFCVKIVQKPSNSQADQPLRILALADGLRPKLADKNKSRSLLPVDWGDFRDEVWRLEFDEKTEPVLYISRHIVDDRDALVCHPAFISLVLPQILRTILNEIVKVQRMEYVDDSTHWSDQWLQTVRSFGVSDPSRIDLDSLDDVDQWIDDAVAAFSRHAKISCRFCDYWWNQGDA